MTKQQSSRILEQGDRGEVIALELPDTTCPAEEFLSGLGSRPQAQFKAALQRLTQAGWLRSPERMRLLEVGGEPKVWEIKAHDGPGYRLYVIRRQTTWVATHGSRKPSDKRVPNEVRRARELYERWGS